MIRRCLFTFAFGHGLQYDCAAALRPDVTIGIVVEYSALRVGGKHASLAAGDEAASRHEHIDGCYDCLGAAT